MERFAQIQQAIQKDPSLQQKVQQMLGETGETKDSANSGGK